MLTYSVPLKRGFYHYAKFWKNWGLDWALELVLRSESVSAFVCQESPVNRYLDESSYFRNAVLVDAHKFELFILGLFATNPEIVYQWGVLFYFR